MYDFLYLREGVGLILLPVVAYIVIRLHFLSGCGIVFSHVIEVGIFILITFPSRLFLFLESSELLVIIDEIQIVLIVGLFFLATFLFFFLLLLLLFLMLF